MGTALNSLMINTGNSFAYDEAYIAYMESHLRFLREHGTTVRMDLDPTLVYKNLYDFYGLFQDMELPPENYYLLLRVNGFYHYTELTEEITSMLQPSDQLLNNLKQLYRTTQTRV